MGETADNFCWDLRSMEKVTGETSLAISWPRGLQLRSRVMLRNTSSDNLQEAKIRGDQASMTSQLSIFRTLNLLRLMIKHNLHQITLRQLCSLRSSIRKSLPWLSSSMTGNHQTKVCHWFSIQLTEMLSSDDPFAGFLPMDLSCKSRIF